MDLGGGEAGVEKGNQPEQGSTEQAGTGTSVEPGTGTGIDPGTGTGTAPAPTDGGAAQGGGSQANQTGPSRTRDPWAGTPTLGETTLPDGTKLRRDADG